MKADEKLPAVEGEVALMQCPHCGEMLSLEEVLLHVAHKQRRAFRIRDAES
jgi:hypothetical protein